MMDYVSREVAEKTLGITQGLDWRPERKDIMNKSETSTHELGYWFGHRSSIWHSLQIAI